MTPVAWLLVGLLLASALAGYRLGNSMRREARRVGEERRATIAASPPPVQTGSEIVEAKRPHSGVATSVQPSPTAEMTAADPTDTVREMLGVPAILEQVYTALKLLPDADWSCPVQAIEIEEFDDPERLMAASEDLPLMATPIYAFLNSEGVNRGKLMVVGPSFFGGGIANSPFAVIEAGVLGPHPRPLQDPAELKGKAISVLGRYMSPTVVLREALMSAGLQSRIWGADEWREREPDPDRVDVLVNRRFDSQVHEVEAGHTDYALIVYPFTHRREIAAEQNGLRHVDLGPIASAMREALSERLLNVLVTRKDRYLSSPAWRKRVGRLHREVERLNRQMARLSQPGAAEALADVAELDDPFDSQEVFESHELDFEAAIRAGVEPAQLLELAKAGNNVGMVPQFDLGSAQGWVEAAA